MNKIQVWGVSTGRRGTPASSEPECSFCHRGPDEDRRILIAPEACICQECVESAQAVLAERIPAR